MCIVEDGELEFNMTPKRRWAGTLTPSGALALRRCGLCRDPKISALVVTEDWFFDHQGSAVPLLYVVRDPGQWKVFCLGSF